MIKDEIKGKWFEVPIRNIGRDGDTLCYKLHNNMLGEFIVSNCLYNTDPEFFPGAMNCLNGSCTLYLEDGEYNFFVVFNNQL